MVKLRFFNEEIAPVLYEWWTSLVAPLIVNIPTRSPLDKIAVKWFEIKTLVGYT